jgi:hypothetical protein
VGTQRETLARYIRKDSREDNQTQGRIFSPDTIKRIQKRKEKATCILNRSRTRAPRIKAQEEHISADRKERKASRRTRKTISRNWPAKLKMLQDKGI